MAHTIIVPAHQVIIVLWYVFMESGAFWKIAVPDDVSCNGTDKNISPQS